LETNQIFQNKEDIMKRSIFVVLIALILLHGTGTVLAVDTHFDGSTDSDWSKAANWSNGVPTAGDNAYIDFSADAQIASYSAEADRLFVDNGNTLTIGSGGQLDLSETSLPAFRLGDTGNADFVLDGGSLNHFATFGGDFKCGSADGSTVNIEVTSGTWITRCLRLGEYSTGDVETDNWAGADDVVTSTVNFLQSGGTIDMNDTGQWVGRLFLPYGSGATAIYTMNGGSLKCKNLYMCFGGTDANPSFGTFNLNSGTVDVIAEAGYFTGNLIVGQSATPSSIASIADFNQTGGTVNAPAVEIARGYKQGTYTISGGSLTATIRLRNGYDNWNGGGVGRFKIIGTGPSFINVQAYRQNGISKLVAEIDSGGITPIVVAEDAIFWSNSMLDISLAPGVSVSTPTQYTLMTTGTGITDNGIKVVGENCQYVTYEIVGNNLVVTYHPDADPERCGEETQYCANPPQYDYDGDCIVGFEDLDRIVNIWLEQNLEPWGPW
jgi:hypothetical protein